ncbi:TPA: hypothetical protein ROU65_003461 [Raoultella ornithinolytica]|nr:hypothetical protein [Raoultella ornithinolytica]HDX8336613.1 hypothetical protein [Raoultella ornithinolytica]
MTKSTITRERAQQIFLGNGPEPSASEERELARMALAAMDNEPAAYTDERNLGYIGRGRETAYLWGKQNSEAGDVPLYRHAQPAPVVPNGLRLALSNAGIAAPESDEMLAATCEKHIQALVTWVRDRKPFQSAPVVMDDRKLRSLFDSWFASDCSFDLSPEASEEDNIAWRESYWYVWQRCRAAMLQAGNSPVIPDGSEWTNEQCLEFLTVAFRHNEISGDIEFDDIRLGVKFALSAAPQEVNHG